MFGARAQHPAATQRSERPAAACELAHGRPSPLWQLNGCAMLVVSWREHAAGHVVPHRQVGRSQGAESAALRLVATGVFRGPAGDGVQIGRRGWKTPDGTTTAGVTRYKERAVGAVGVEQHKPAAVCRLQHARTLDTWP